MRRGWQWVLSIGLLGNLHVVEAFDWKSYSRQEATGAAAITKVDGQYVATRKAFDAETGAELSSLVEPVDLDGLKVEVKRLQGQVDDLQKLITTLEVLPENVP